MAEKIGRKHEHVSLGPSKVAKISAGWLQHVTACTSTRDRVDSYGINNKARQRFIDSVNKEEGDPDAQASTIDEDPSYYVLCYSAGYDNRREALNTFRKHLRDRIGYNAMFFMYTVVSSNTLIWNSTCEILMEVITFAEANGINIDAKPEAGSRTLGMTQQV